MHVIVGLGNPGRRYRSTRHNIGFMVVDYMAEQKRLSWEAGAGDYLIARGAAGKYALVKPLTYMNNSGQALAQLRQKHHPDWRDTLIIYDDLDLPLGRMRFRPGGSAGTHRGMQSMLRAAGTDQVPRLRMGIGSELKTGPAEEFVLRPFAKAERPVVKTLVERASEGILTFMHRDIETAMNTYNQIDATQ